MSQGAIMSYLHHLDLAVISQTTTFKLKIRYQMMKDDASFYITW